MEAVLRSLLADHAQRDTICTLWAMQVERAERERQALQAALASGLAGAERERQALQAALASAEASAGRERESAKEARESAKEARESTKEARESAKAGAARNLEFAQREHQLQAEALQAALDQLRGVLGSRSKLERIAYELAPTKSVTAAITEAFGSAATRFHGYLKEVAQTRSMKLSDLVDAGKGVYQDLSARIHHGVSDEAPYEADCLEGIAKTKLVALAALFKFHKRRHGFLRESLPTPASTPPSV